MKVKSLWHISSESESKRRRHTLISRKDSDLFRASARDRTKKLEWMRVWPSLDGSLKEFWVKARWIGSIFHLAAFFALSCFAVGRCSFGRTSDFYVHFEVLPPTTGETFALSENTFCSRICCIFLQHFPKTICFANMFFILSFHVVTLILFSDLYMHSMER